MLTGSAAVGKTSFCDLLFQSKYSSEYKSTEIMETKQAMSIAKFSMLKQEKEVVWLKLNLKNQISHFKMLLNCRAFKKESSTKFSQECASVACSNQETVQNFTSDPANYPMIPQGSIVNKVWTSVEKKILSSDSLPVSLTINKNESVKFMLNKNTLGVKKCEANQKQHC